MRKIFLITFLLATFFCVTTFAAEENSAEKNSVEESSAATTEKNSVEENLVATEENSVGFDYTSKTFGFKIMCPAEPKVVVNPFPDPKKRGELLVFANDGATILYGYQIQFEAFDTNTAPDFNKAKKKTLDAYLEKLKINNAYEDAIVDDVSEGNKGVFAVTAREIEVKNSAGEVEGVAVAQTQNEVVFFRTKSGRCISIQLITTNLNDEVVLNFRKSVATYKDATDLLIDDNDKKSKSKKSKK